MIQLFCKAYIHYADSANHLIRHKNVQYSNRTARRYPIGQISRNLNLQNEHLLRQTTASEHFSIKYFTLFEGSSPCSADGCSIFSFWRCALESFRLSTSRSSSYVIKLHRPDIVLLFWSVYRFQHGSSRLRTMDSENE